MECFRVRPGFQNVDQGRTLGCERRRSKDRSRRLHTIRYALHRSHRLAARMSEYFHNTIPGFEERESVSLGSLTFTRGVATTRGVAHMESRCNACGFRLSALDAALDSGEREHATSCAGLTTE